MGLQLVLLSHTYVHLICYKRSLEATNPTEEKTTKIDVQGHGQ